MIGTCTGQTDCAHSEGVVQLQVFAHIGQLFEKTHVVLGSGEGFAIPNLTQGRLCHPVDLKHWVLDMAVPISTIHIHS